MHLKLLHTCSLGPFQLRFFFAVFLPKISKWHATKLMWVGYIPTLNFYLLFAYTLNTFA